MHKCKNCGKEFESKFCPDCGAESDEVQRSLTEKLTIDILKNGIDKVWQTYSKEQAHKQKQSSKIVSTVIIFVSKDFILFS